MVPAGAADLPRAVDLLVVGGGTSGAALAGLLACQTNAAVLLLEAGPDYGPRESGRWPADLLDACRLGLSHDWGYDGLAHATQPAPIPFNRARVLGGCSAHNGCVALLGHRLDYDGWAALGNARWDWQSVEPAFARAMRALQVTIPGDDVVTPYQQVFVDGAVAAGIPRVHDLNDPHACEGVAPSPANIVAGVRWNSAFAYLDPARTRPNLTILGDVLVDRLVFDGRRAVAVEAIVAGERRRIAAHRIVLAAGAYGSPAILLRSGIGPVSDLQAIGIAPVHDLPGVGQQLVDHPTVILRFRGSAALNRAMEQFGEPRRMLEEQTLAKTRSSRCRAAFDLHLYAVSHRDEAGDWEYVVCVSSVLPSSRGALRLRSADPDASPLIDHGYLTDPTGHDLAVLRDGVLIAREALSSAPTAWAIAGEIGESAHCTTSAQLSDWIERHVGIYYHPASTCRMGPARDPLAVVDPTGNVHGLEGLAICDAAIFPVIMRANTNLPAAMLAEQMAPWLRA